MFVSMGLLRLLYLIILLVIALILMATTNWKLALVAWVFMPIIAARSTQVSLSLRPIWMKIQNLQGRMGTVLQESLSGIRVVKAFAREEEESAKFSIEAKDLFDNAFTANRIQATARKIWASKVWLDPRVARSAGDSQLKLAGPEGEWLARPPGTRYVGRQVLEGLWADQDH